MRRSLLTGALLAGAGLLSGCAATVVTPDAVARSVTQTVVPLSIAVTPADKATDVPPNTTVVVSASGGHLTAVSVTPQGGGPALKGEFSATSTAWAAHEWLVPATAYTVSATAVDPKGHTTSVQTTLTTLANTGRLITSVFPADGATVGVGMPIKLVFNTDIPLELQAALVSHLVVTSQPRVSGSWHWFSDREVHFRPNDYWPSGTKVTLQANLQGVDAGNGIWGIADWSSSFTVGEKHVSIIDDSTHTMQVYKNDSLLYTWPVSLGVPNTWPTISGTLVVWGKTYDVLMDSLSIGIPRNAPGGYYEHVYWDTAISTDGFYIHSAPWSVWAQGHTDVSHGCVNLSPDHAQTFFNFSQAGDVVIIKNTNRVANVDDGEADWQIPAASYANSGATGTPAPQSPHSSGGL